MKILIVSQYFFPENFRINDFAFSMRRKGHEVTVLTGLPNYPKGRLFGHFRLFQKHEVNGVDIYRVPLIPRFKSSGFQLAINYLSFLFSGLIFGPILLSKRKYDVIFTTNYSPATVGIIGVILSKIKRAKMVLWVQDLWPESLKATGAIESKAILRIIATMVRWIYKHSHNILIQSKAFQSPIINLGIPNQKIHYFPNWAEDLYSPNDLANDRKIEDLIPKEKFIVMFAGNLGKAQSLETIIRAAKITQDRIHWVILGDGRERSRMEEDITSLGIENISLLGAFPMDYMPYFFKLSDVLLVTLRKDPIFSATIPGKIQSYMLSSKPIIAALDGEGARVIRESNCGFVVDSGDYEGLAKSADSLSLMDQSDLNEMGKNGFEYYRENFDRDNLIRRFESLLEESK